MAVNNVCLYPKVCSVCGKEYMPTGHHQKWCRECTLSARKEVANRCNKHWQENNPEKVRGYGRRWESANPDKVHAKHKRWQVRHPNYYREYNKVWSAGHPGRVKNWRLDYPDNAKASDLKSKSRRRTLGFVPLNSWFVGCEGHHINKNDIIYLPRKMHRSVWHNQRTGQGMAEMNALAGNFLTQDWT